MVYNTIPKYYHVGVYLPKIPTFWIKYRCVGKNPYPPAIFIKKKLKKKILFF